MFPVYKNIILKIYFFYVLPISHHAVLPDPALNVRLLTHTQFYQDELMGKALTCLNESGDKLSDRSMSVQEKIGFTFLCNKEHRIFIECT